MMAFLRAHGMDPGPLQRPILAGALAGLLAALPAGAVFWAFGSFQVAADQVMRLPRPLAAALLAGAFTASGALYGLVLRRAANDRRGGWLFGAVFAFGLWMAAPVVVLPLVGASLMAAGRPAAGFLACFLTWGFVAGGLFPHVHRPLHARMDGKGPLAGVGGVSPANVLRRAPRRWR